MKTFKDLKFKKHPNADSMYGSLKKQARMDFDNGYGISVIVGGSGVYGDVHYPYECAVMKEGRLCYDTPVTGDVIGYCNENRVTEIMKQIQEL